MATAVATSPLKFLGGQTLVTEHSALADVRGANALSADAIKQLVEISKRAIYRDEVRRIAHVYVYVTLLTMCYLTRFLIISNNFR